MVRSILVNIVMGTIFSVFTNLLSPYAGVKVASLIVLASLTVLSFVATKRFVFSPGKTA